MHHHYIVEILWSNFFGCRIKNKHVKLLQYTSFIFPGINIESIVNMAADSSNINSETRKKVVKTIARHIEEAIQLQKEFGQV